jgi:hypothetical protein
VTHKFGIYNVSNSINYLIKSQLPTYAPAWLTWSYGASQPRTLNFNFPEQPLNFPSFSVTHMSDDVAIQSEGDRADGIYKGTIQQGIFDLSCWVLEMVTDANGKPTGEKNEKWWLQMQQMRDAAVLMLKNNRSIPLYDCTDPNNLVALTAIARIQEVRSRVSVPDPNPAVRRTIITATYRWAERFT